MERNGFDYELVEDLKGYVVSLPKSAWYAQILKNSVAQSETLDERIFLMKDTASVDEAIGFGAKIYERVVFSNFYRYLYQYNKLLDVV